MSTPKLMIVCIQYHACILVKGGDTIADAIKEAKDSVIATIKSEDGLAPHDAFAMEPKHERDLPFDWKDQQPFASAEIDDDAFAKFACTAEGEALTTLETFKSLYTKG
jgi:hypothetical protein